MCKSRRQCAKENSKEQNLETWKTKKTSFPPENHRTHNPFPITKKEKNSQHSLKKIKSNTVSCIEKMAIKVGIFERKHNPLNV